MPDLKHEVTTLKTLDEPAKGLSLGHESATNEEPEIIGSATGALGDARKERRRKNNNKMSRRGVVFSDDEPEVIGSASDWAMESGQVSGEASAAPRVDQHFSNPKYVPSSLAWLLVSPIHDESPTDMANPDRFDHLGLFERHIEIDLDSLGSFRAAPSVGNVGSVGSNADGDWSARKVDAYGRWYQAMNKHQPVRAAPIACRFSQEVTHPISRCRRFRS